MIIYSVYGTTSIGLQDKSVAGWCKNRLISNHMPQTTRILFGQGLPVRLLLTLGK